MAVNSGLHDDGPLVALAGRVGLYYQALSGGCSARLQCAMNRRRLKSASAQCGKMGVSAPSHSTMICTTIAGRWLAVAVWFCKIEGESGHNARRTVKSPRLTFARPLMPASQRGLWTDTSSSSHDNILSLSEYRKQGRNGTRAAIEIQGLEASSSTYLDLGLVHVVGLEDISGGNA